MNEWLIIIIGILVFFAVFLIFGLIFFLLLKRLDCGIKPEIDRIAIVQEERQSIIVEGIDLLERHGLDNRFDLEQFEVEVGDDLLKQRDKQQFGIMIMRKIIEEENSQDQELLDFRSRLIAMAEDSEKIYQAYNKKVRTFNSLYNLIFVKPFTAFSKLKSYPYLR